MSQPDDIGPSDLSDQHGGQPWWRALPDRLATTLQLYAGDAPDAQHRWLWEWAAIEADDVASADDEATWEAFAAERRRRYEAMCAIVALRSRDDPMGSP